MSRDRGSTSQWTDRDLEIVETLTTKVRVLTLSQVATTWWKGSRRSARRRMARLVEGGLVEQYRLETDPLLALDEPVRAWRPGTGAGEAIDPAATARELKRRWRLPPIPVTVYTATTLAANMYGSFGGGLRQPLQVSHDLHLAQVYLQYRRTRPEQARRWRGEDLYTKAGHGIKDPDAFIVNDDGAIQSVIEFGGRYDAERVAQFHAHCVSENVPYELW